MSQGTRTRDGFTFGGRMPWAVGLLLALTITTSLIVAFGGRHGAPLYDLGVLDAGSVGRGQVFRLFTWSLIEPSAAGLIFACLAYYFLGREIAEETGSKRFLAIFGAVALTAGVATCLVALLDPAVYAHKYVGGWALTASMIVAWGLWFPHRVVRLFFFVPVRGYWIAWLTVAGTAVVAIYSGWVDLFPTVASLAAILLWLYFPALAARLRRARKVTKTSVAKRARTRKYARAAVEVQTYAADDEEEPPPLPGDLEARVSELLRVRKERKD